MLSTESAEVIRATLPTVGAAIGDITPLFYSKLFAAHPELERDLFNRSRQKLGEQQMALAGAIAAFAALLIDPDTAGDGNKGRSVLARIANKHASLGVTAEQYQVVGKYLFEAIVDVIGAAVTPDVAKAWDEVYWLMANTLISLESDVYNQNGLEPGDVWRKVSVRRRTLPSPDTVTFVLSALDGAPLPRVSRGQYLSVGVRLPDGARQIRQYPLTNPPTDGDWQISVKRLQPTVAPDGGRVDVGEVSNFLYNNVFEGDCLDVTIPVGSRGK